MSRRAEISIFNSNSSSTVLWCIFMMYYERCEEKQRVKFSDLAPERE